MMKMRNMRIKFIGILTIGIFFLFFLSNASHLINDMQANENTNLPTLKTSSSWNLNELYIDGDATGVGAHNWSWVLEQPWFFSRYSYYGIRNVIIKGNNLGIGIEINNPNHNFIIENCTISNVGIGISITNSTERVEITNTRILNIYGINGTDGADGTNSAGQTGSNGQDATGLMISFSKNFRISSVTISRVYGGNGGNGGNGAGGRLFFPNGYNGGGGGYGGVSNGILFRNSTGIDIENVNISSIIGGFGGNGGNGGDEFGGSSARAGRGGTGRSGNIGLGMDMRNSTIDLMKSSVVSQIYGGNGGDGGNGGNAIGPGISGSGGYGGNGDYGVGFRIEEGYIKILNTERIELFGGRGGKGGDSGAGTGGTDGNDGYNSTGRQSIWISGNINRIYIYDMADFTWMGMIVLGGIIIGIVIILLTGFIRGGVKVMERRKETNARLKAYRAESSTPTLSFKKIPVNRVNDSTTLTVEKVPVNRVNWIEKAEKFKNSDDLEQALKCIDEALKQNPNSSEAWYKMGEILEKLGEYEKGLECYQKAMRFKTMNS